MVKGMKKIILNNTFVMILEMPNMLYLAKKSLVISGLDKFYAIHTHTHNIPSKLFY